MDFLLKTYQGSSAALYKFCGSGYNSLDCFYNSFNRSKEVIEAYLLLKAKLAEGPNLTVVIKSPMSDNLNPVCVNLSDFVEKKDAIIQHIFEAGEPFIQIKSTFIKRVYDTTQHVDPTWLQYFTKGVTNHFQNYNNKDYHMLIPQLFGKLWKWVFRASDGRFEVTNPNGRISKSVLMKINKINDQNRVNSLPTLPKTDDMCILVFPEKMVESTIADPLDLTKEIITKTLEPHVVISIRPLDAWEPSLKQDVSLDELSVQDLTTYSGLFSSSSFNMCDRLCH